MSSHLRAVSVLPIVETFRNKRLLVTGVTGFLGKVWLAMLLEHAPDLAEVIVLARGKKGESTTERFERIVERSPAFRSLREKFGSDYRRLIASKIRVVDAKLTAPNCGLEEVDARLLMSNVDVVVHFAGLTDFEPDPQLAIDANIHGAAHAADLAAMSPSRRYVHVSTTFVAGQRNGRIEERITPGIAPNGVVFSPAEELSELESAIADLPTKKERTQCAMTRAKRLGWPNIYTYTKGLSEHLIEPREDVRTTTFRPAIVECARSYPFKGWNEGINTSGPIVWLLSTTFQRFPAKATNRFDVVPVDTVARSMMLVVAASLRGEAASVYQCASGQENPLFFGRATELATLGLRILARKQDGDVWEKHVRPRFDASCVEDVDAKQVFGFRRVRSATKATRSFLKDFKLSRWLSPELFDKINGAELEDDLKRFSTDLRTTDRKLGTVDEMLRQYRPFIWDYHYIFQTDGLVRESARLSEEERKLFGFDVKDICWRQYWCEVQVPGLEKWSLPLLRNEKVPEDEPLPLTEPSRDGVRVRLHADVSSPRAQTTDIAL